MDNEEFNIELRRPTPGELVILIVGKPTDLDKLEAEILEQAQKDEA